MSQTPRGYVIRPIEKVTTVIEDTPHILFENRSTAEIFRAVNPHYEGRVFCVDEILPTPAATNEQRIHWLQEQLPAEASSQAEEFLHALEELRGAPLSTPDDAEFAFSSLPDTPKNRALRGLLLFYLNSPLAQDRTTALLRKMEEWRQGLPPPAAGAWILASDPARPDGLTELARALAVAPGVTDVTISDSWRAGAPRDGKRRALFFPRSGPRSLNSLIEAASSRLPAVVVFQGTAAEQSWLKLALEAKNISFRDGLPATATAASLEIGAVGHYLTRLRQNTGLPLGDRLRLVHQLNEAGAALWNPTHWTQGIDRLKEISAEERSLLKGLPESTYGETLAPIESEHPSLWIVPYPGVGVSGGKSVWIHADLERLPSLGTSGLLREAERDRLATAGFSLRRAANFRMQCRRAWDYWTSPASSRRWVFTDEPVVGNRRWRLPVPPTAAPSAPRVLPGSGSRTLSATQLETYARCPARYWFGHALRLRRSDPDGAGYALVLGQVVHKALENAFRESAEPPDAKLWKAGLPAAFARALQEEAPQVPVDSRLAAELRGPFVELLTAVPHLEWHLRDTLGNRFRPKALEQDFDFDWHGIRLRGKIDRIDESPDGELLILDYKTGAVDFTPGHINQGKSFQALVYLLAAERLFGRTPAGMLFYDLKEGEIRRGILREEAFSADVKKAMTRGHVLNAEAWDRMKAEGWEKLQSLAQRIASGDFAATPDAENCSRCDYVALCRQAVGYG